MPVTIQLSPTVRAILEASTITEDRVVLPPTQLDRQTYEAVDKVLKAAGGKWNRSQKAHVFTRDPREALGLALQTGTVTDQKVLWQQYNTPAWLARDMAAQAHIQSYAPVLEPSAGTGMLAQAAALYTPKRCVTCVEIDPLLAPALRQDGFRVLEGDFLRVVPERRVEHVLMNPPFTKHQDMAHILHACDFLQPGGTLVAIAGAGVLSGSTKLHGTFRTLLDAYGATVTPLPEDTFAEAATGVNTVLIVLTIPR